jgi:Domain of unknown function (DUF4430)
VLRKLVLFALVAVVTAVVITPAALAAKVKIRVEGRTTTIYGSAQPTVTADHPLQALDVASTLGEFHYALTSSSFGDYVSHIGKYAAAGTSGWAFKVNGASPPVGADKVALKDGDTVLWYWAAFGPAGGPPTLELQRLPGNCYVVQSADDKGTKTRAATATLVVDGKRFRTRSGRACVGRHTGLVRAVAPGAVRSNALR